MGTSRGAGEQGSADSPVPSHSQCVTANPKLDSDMDSDLGHMPDLLLGANTADVRHQTEVIISFGGIVSFLFSPFELSLPRHLRDFRMAHQNKLHSPESGAQIWLEKHLQTQIAS